MDTDIQEPITPETLAELRRLRDASTPGPYGVSFDIDPAHMDEHEVRAMGKYRMTVFICGRKGDAGLADARFAAAAHSAMPALLAEIERYRNHPRPNEA